MFRSIRFRLAFWYTTAFALTFALISGVIYEYVSRTLSDRLDESIMNEIRWVAARYEKQFTRTESDQAVRDDIFEHASFYPIKEYVEIWDNTGQRFYGSPNLAGDTLSTYIDIAHPPSQIVTITKFRDHHIRLVVQQSMHATILLSMPMESVTTPISQLLRIFIWIGPIVIVVAAAGGMYLAKQSFAKINQVIRTAERITADRLHDRIPEHDTKDEIGRIISTFNEMISRLDVSFGQMKQFSADASHELRTPLSVIRTQLEMALNSGISQAEMKEIIANCLDEALHMSSIIENLLLLAKGDAGQNILRREPVDLKALMHQMYDESVLISSSKQITVTLKDPAPATIIGDEQRLRQMLLNLIDNAIKYNRVRWKISLALGKGNGVAKITVADTGIGISEQEIPRIFDRFYRVDRARSRELGGVGLGLAIAKWIVQAHGGSITVKSAMNAGTEFCVMLPLDGSSA
ncbi:MAG: HAMP domain-containing protein [Ignavibacteriae bacterium]|nr:HAMP domain-containing protein [Ignavibacteriota bacterium]